VSMCTERYVQVCEEEGIAMDKEDARNSVCPVLCCYVCCVCLYPFISSDHFPPFATLALSLTIQIIKALQELGTDNYLYRLAPLPGGVDSEGGESDNEEKKEEVAVAVSPRGKKGAAAKRKRATPAAKDTAASRKKLKAIEAMGASLSSALDLGFGKEVDDSSVYWALNYDHFIRDLRKEAFVDYVSLRRGGLAGTIIGLIMETYPIDSIEVPSALDVRAIFDLQQKEDRISIEQLTEHLREMSASSVRLYFIIYCFYIFLFLFFSFLPSPSSYLLSQSSRSPSP